MWTIAHHVAAHHVPILAMLFGVGVWAGWQLAGTLPAFVRKPQT